MVLLFDVLLLQLQEKALWRLEGVVGEVQFVAEHLDLRFEERAPRQPWVFQDCATVIRTDASGCIIPTIRHWADTDMCLGKNQLMRSRTWSGSAKLFPAHLRAALADAAYAFAKTA